MIELEDLTKRFGGPEGAVVAVDRVTLRVPRGEICVLLGPSGCGKTTTLKMINRLLQPTSGKIYIDGKDTDEYDAVTLRRMLGYVIQQVGLFPNMTVEENVTVVPRLLGWDRKKRHERAREVVRMMALEPDDFLHRYPNELSGGQQQRIGVARGLAADPPVLLMDEAFGAVDPINRAVIQDEFLKMQADVRKTVMFVSHDIDEAIKMGDRIAIFRGGRLEQYDTPDNILAHPANDFIADFVGGDRTLKRLRLLTVAAAMNEDPPTVARDDAVETALRRMRDSGDDAVAVVGSNGRPEGVVRLIDLDGAQGTCGDHERPLPTAVETGQDLRVALSNMLACDADWLPCVNGEGAFCGAITHSRITHTLAGRAGPPAEERAREAS